MSDLPKGTQIWLRSFYGFSPEEDGYVGWTQESARNRKLEQLNDGDLLMIYGASSAETEAALRSYVLGFVQIDATPIRDVDKASDLGMARKREAGWDDKWSYAMPVRRAWRAEEKMMISRIAFNSYRAEAGQALAVHSAVLDDDEIAQTLKIRVREVDVFGETPVSEERTTVQPFAEVFKPSRAFPGSFGVRTLTYEDGETFVYLSVFQGDSHALLGRKRSFSDKSVALKIGVANDPKRRLSELNSGLPPAAIGKWGPLMTSQPFPNKAGAEELETLFKERARQIFESLGGEFFWGSQDAAESLFWALPGMSRF